MRIRKQLAKGVSYAVAPKATWATLHPRKAMFGKAASWAMNRVSPARRRRARRRTAVTGLGAAAMAVPVGLWLGRRFFSARLHEEQATAEL
jgi:hypothetical protein